VSVEAFPDISFWAPVADELLADQRTELLRQHAGD
jgi:hypothetical protein